LKSSQFFVIIKDLKGKKILPLAKEERRGCCYEKRLLHGEG